ncbi:hypothetical protein [Natronorubrum tibetense]|uniref:Uncharacterized protein n=1 Tax=Natronorubrum tibetense GA33 TaxID=1114856 RepID=L9VX93_9EURY|nr:hypothetical protein [Natronorubrum tibetense]ELY41799.1 hypothetical protein C496_08391 [Natronorubrum tibetense GA33]
MRIELPSSALGLLERIRRLGDRLRSVGQPVTSSVSLLLVVAGICVVTVAYLLQYGVWPALMAVWGTFLLVFGTTWYLVVRWSRS